MARKAVRREGIIAGLDIGTTKIVFAIGSKQPDGIHITGIGTSPSTGMKQGAVVHIDATTEAICKAREEAELMSGYQVDEAWVGISGSHIRSFDSKGMVAIRNQEVTREDIHRVIEAAQAVAVPSDRDVLHVLPREFKVDEQDGIEDPVAMSGVRLEAAVHIVTGARSALQNTVKCIAKSGLRVTGLVLQPLASALAVLSSEEKKLGVAAVDMGGGTCDVVLYVRGSVAYTAVIPLGGNHFTTDVAMGLRTPQSCAEELKKKFGSALLSRVKADETVEVNGVGGRDCRTLLRKNLCEVIEPRAEEALGLIHNEIRKSGMMDLLGSGVVLTGGASQLDGLVELAEIIYDVPVRKGVPTEVKGLTEIIKAPAYATAVGLLKYGWEKQRLLEVEDLEGARLGGWVRRVKELMSGGGYV